MIYALTVPSLPTVSHYTSALGSSTMLTSSAMVMSSTTVRKCQQPSALSRIQTDLTSIIESSISIILCSLPSTTKLFHVYIEPTQIYQSLQSRLGSGRGTEDSSFRNRSIPTIGSDPKPARQKRDPYSINMPTTILSTKLASLTGSSDLELSPRKNGDVQTHVRSSHASGTLASADIPRRISVEHLSASFHSSEQDWHDEGGLLQTYP
jgi:hypothetical protein